GARGAAKVFRRLFARFGEYISTCRQRAAVDDATRLCRDGRWAVGAASWGSFGIEQNLPTPPRCHQGHRLLTTRTKGRRTDQGRFEAGQFDLRIGWWFPRFLFGWAEQGLLAKQGAHAVGADFGGG